MVREILPFAADLGDPPETQVPPRARQFFLPDEPRERSSDLQSAGAAGTVVIGGILFFLHVTSEHDILIADRRPFDEAFHHYLPGLTAGFRFDLGVHLDRFRGAGQLGVFLIRRCISKIVTTTSYADRRIDPPASSVQIQNGGCQSGIAGAFP